MIKHLFIYCKNTAMVYMLQLFLQPCIFLLKPLLWIQFLKICKHIQCTYVSIPLKFRNHFCVWKNFNGSSNIKGDIIWDQIRSQKWSWICNNCKLLWLHTYLFLVHFICNPLYRQWFANWFKRRAQNIIEFRVIYIYIHSREAKEVNHWNHCGKKIFPSFEIWLIYT